MTDIPITVPEILSVFATLKIHRSATTNPCRDITKIPSWRHKDAIPIYQSCKKTANRKNLRLLDGIALLLVTERTSDGAAVSMTNRAHGELIKTTIHMVKNRECTEKEKNYYETFIELINDSTINSVTLEDELSNLVLENCRAQIINRAVKLRRAIKRYRNVHRTWRAENSTIQKDISEFRKLYKLSAFKAPTWPELLDHFLLEGLHPDQFSTTEGGRALWLVHEFVINDHLLNSIPSLKVTSRLRKLAEYVQTLLTITKHVARKRRNRIFQLEIIPSPKPVNIPPIESPITLIDRCVKALHLQLGNFSLLDLKTLVPDAKQDDLTASRPETTAPIHCECTLALAMRRPRTHEKLEIGVSKRCCWPCVEFLSRLSDPPGSIVVSASRGKIVRDWAWPVNVPLRVRERVEDTVRVEFWEWLLRLDKKRVYG